MKFTAVGIAAFAGLAAAQQSGLGALPECSVSRLFDHFRTCLVYTCLLCTRYTVNGPQLNEAGRNTG